MTNQTSFPPHYADAFQRASENLRRVLPLINRHKTPINPVNYAVWYDYVSGNNQALTNAIDIRLRQKEPITAELTEYLYQKFVLMGMPEKLVKTHHELGQVVDTALTNINQAELAANDCASGLSQSQGLLETCQDIEQMKVVLATIIDDTRKLSLTSHALKQQLNDSTREIQKLRQELQTVKAQARNDALTGLLNRGSFNSELTQLCQEGKTAFTLVLFDIDNFKQINDRFGHLLGDKVLQFFASLMKQQCDDLHYVARFGGEELAIILLHSTAQDATETAENIRSKFSESRLKRKDSEESIGTVTVSAGISQYQTGDSMNYLIERADAALYESKQAGRNCITIR